MIKAFKAVALGLSLLLANVSVCSAQDFKKGLAAAQKGDYAAALREWRPLAEQGDADAQYNLGVMYAEPRSRLGRREIAGCSGSVGILRALL